MNTGRTEPLVQIWAGVSEDAQATDGATALLTNGAPKNE